MAEELKPVEPLDYDFKQVDEVIGEEEANQRLGRGWKLINTFKRGKDLVYVLGLPQGSTAAERPPQKRGFFGVFAFVVGISLIWLVMNTAQQRFLVFEFELLESVLLLIAIFLTIIGLSQIVGMVPALAEHMR